MTASQLGGLHMPYMSTRRVRNDWVAGPNRIAREGQYADIVGRFPVIRCRTSPRCNESNRDEGRKGHQERVNGPMMFHV